MTDEYLKYFYHRNFIWSISHITDGSGSIVERYDYSAFGKSQVFSNPGEDGVWNSGDDVQGESRVGSVLGFQGRRLDVESGLLYYRTRHYSHRLGRFIQRDSIGSWKSRVCLGCEYSFVGNRAFSILDPLGELEPEEIGLWASGKGRAKTSEGELIGEKYEPDEEEEAESELEQARTEAMEEYEEAGKTVEAAKTSRRWSPLGLGGVGGAMAYPVFRRSTFMGVVCSLGAGIVVYMYAYKYTSITVGNLEKQQGEVFAMRMTEATKRFKDRIARARGKR